MKGAGRGTSRNHRKAIHDNLFRDVQIHYVANVGGRGRNGLAKFQVNRRAIVQDEVSWGEGGSARTAFGGRGGCVIQNALSRGLHRPWLRCLGARLVLQQEEALQRDITYLALGGADAEVKVVPAGDLYQLSTLERRAHIQCNHGTV